MTIGVTPEPRVHSPSPPDMLFETSSHYIGTFPRLLLFQPAGLALLGSNTHMCARQRAKHLRSCMLRSEKRLRRRTKMNESFPYGRLQLHLCRLANVPNVWKSLALLGSDCLFSVCTSPN